MIRWLGVVLLVVLSGCAIDLDAKAASGELFACAVDADCVPVSTGCGDCGSAGRQIMINGEYVDATLLLINEQYESAWDARRSKECEGLGVVFQGSQHVSCFSDPVCADGRCVLVPNASRLCEGWGHHYLCLVQDFEYQSSYEMYGIDCEDVFEICSAYDEERYGWRTPR